MLKYFDFSLKLYNVKKSLPESESSASGIKKML